MAGIRHRTNVYQLIWPRRLKYPRFLPQAHLLARSAQQLLKIETDRHGLSGDFWNRTMNRGASVRDERGFRYNIQVDTFHACIQFISHHIHGQAVCRVSRSIS